MNNNDKFKNSNYDVSSMAPLDGDDERKSGAEREDASGWDRLSDGQRKLIAVGVLIGIVVFLVLMLAVGSSCGACADCAARNRVSASDAESGERLPEIIVEDPVSSTDLPGSGEEVTEPVVSDGDVSSADVIEDNTEYVEVVRPGGLSACSHQADNEAGGGSSGENGGFLGFLFGCSGCAEGCSIDVNSSLTDREDSDDPTRQDGMILSGSDAPGHLWEAQPDDEAYIELLRVQLASVSEQFASLNALDTALAPYTDPQRVRDNDRFRKLTEEMLQWCDAAEGYDASLLTGDNAHACNMLSVRLAGDLRRYIDEYPLLITGAISGADVLEKSDHLNAIMGDIVELYAALNPSPVTVVPEVTADAADAE